VVRDRAKFIIGIVGLLTFSVALTIWLSPIIAGQTGLQWADTFFNQLSKNSSHFTPKVMPEVENHRGKAFDVEVGAKAPETAQHIAALFDTAGAQAKLNGKKVALKGDLGAVAQAVIADAEVMYQNREQELQTRYGFSGREVIFCWWTALDAINQHALDAGDLTTSYFVNGLMTKVCEPAYNFAGITPRSVSDSWLPLFGLLAFYLAYTVLYGFSILYLFEGLGITAQATPHAERQEG